MKNTSLDHDQGRLELLRSETAETFVCFRCQVQKKSKLRARWRTAQGIKNVCNGCYRELLSRRGA